MNEKFPTEELEAQVITKDLQREQREGEERNERGCAISRPDRPQDDPSCCGDADMKCKQGSELEPRLRQTATAMLVA